MDARYRSESTTASFRGIPHRRCRRRHRQNLSVQSSASLPPPSADARAPPRAAPVVVAFSISPIHVRGADQPAKLHDPPGTDVVRLHLQGQAGVNVWSVGERLCAQSPARKSRRGRATGLVDSQPRHLLASTFRWDDSERMTTSSNCSMSRREFVELNSIDTFQCASQAG